MGKLVDLTGQKFGRLTVIEIHDKRDRFGNVLWKCVCDCGKFSVVRGVALTRSRTKSCGCLKIETARSPQMHPPTHGGIHDRLYRVWQGMNDRCNRTTAANYKNYGGRGIQVTPEWRHDYVAFRDWALTNGYDKDAPFGGCTLDRIDVNGNYAPDNCRWVDMKVQAINKRRKAGA